MVQQKQTDMERIIKVAEVYLDTKVTASSVPGMVNHPVFSIAYENISGPDGEKNVDILKDPEGLNLAREQMRQFIRSCKTPVEVFMLFRKGFRFDLLQTVKNLLSAEDLSAVLRYSWETYDNPNKDNCFSKTELIDLFSSCIPEVLMEKEELEVLKNLPEEVTVYRGVTTYNQKVVRALSWTLNIEVAKKFAERYWEENGTIYQAEIKKENILAYFEGEEEVIVIPRRLHKIVALESPEQ